MQVKILREIDVRDGANYFKALPNKEYIIQDESVVETLIAIGAVELLDNKKVEKDADVFGMGASEIELVKPVKKGK